LNLMWSEIINSNINQESTLEWENLGIDWTMWID
jgi:hypothetical protein